MNVKNEVELDLMRQRRGLLKAFFFLPGVGLLSACGGGQENEDASQIPDVDLLESSDADVAIFEKDDLENPLHIFRFPITRRIQKLAFDLTDGCGDVMLKLERMMYYIDEFPTGIASASTPDVTARERVGACGTFTALFLAMARCLGIPGRYVGLYNYPENDGHTIPELFLNGKWMAFDPTYHLYYAHSDTPTIPLSYEEVYFAYVKNMPVVAVGGNKRLGADEFTERNIYVQANPQGVIGPSRPMLYPLKLDVLEKPNIDQADFTAENQGSEYIGAAGVNIEQSWELSGIEPGVEHVFRIVPDWVGGDITWREAYFQISYSIIGGEGRNAPSGVFDFRGGRAENFELLFLSDRESVTIEIRHPYRGPGFLYLKVVEYGVYRSGDPRLMLRPAPKKMNKSMRPKYAMSEIL